METHMHDRIQTQTKLRETKREGRKEILQNASKRSKMAYLPYDLLVFEILSRLPGKTIVKFKTVSKQFNSLISSPHFLRLHHARSRNSPFLLHAISRPPLRLYEDIATMNILFTTNQDNVITDKFTRQMDGWNFKILPSHHQFVCFLCDKKTYLCDPTTQKFLELPSSLSRPFFSKKYFTGFGFIPSTMEYKVVRLFIRGTNPNGRNDSIGCDVLTISTKTGRLNISPWRQLDEGYPYLVDGFPVLANGCLHWKTYKPVGNDAQLDHIVSFNLEDEKFSTLLALPCSSTSHQDHKDHCLGLFGIRENLSVMDYFSDDAIMEIWVLKDWKKYKWMKEHRIELGETAGTYPRLSYRTLPVEVLDIWKDQILFRLIYPSRLKCYNVARKTIDDHGEIEERFQLCHYTDGLLSLAMVN